MVSKHSCLHIYFDLVTEIVAKVRFYKAYFHRIVPPKVCLQKRSILLCKFTICETDRLFLNIYDVNTAIN